MLGIVQNPHVKSYAEKIYNSYERICKVLVTYPSLEFKNNQFNIIKDKNSQFIMEYFNSDDQVKDNEIKNIIKLVNISLSHYLESNPDVEHLIQSLATDQKRIKRLIMFLKEASGEDYTRYFKRVVAKN